jgi:hypothetical protein
MEEIIKKEKDLTEKLQKFFGFHMHFICFVPKYNYELECFDIEIHPKKEGFNSQKYFMYHFETKKGQEALEKFSKENKLGLVKY